ARCPFLPLGLTRRDTRTPIPPPPNRVVRRRSRGSAGPRRGEVLAPTTQDRDAAVKVVPRTEGALLVENLVPVDRYRAVPDRPSTGLLRVDEAGRDERIEQSGPGGHVRPGTLGGRVDESLLRECHRAPAA